MVSQAIETLQEYQSDCDPNIQLALEVGILHNIRERFWHPNFAPYVYSAMSPRSACSTRRFYRIAQSLCNNSSFSSKAPSQGRHWGPLRSLGFRLWGPVTRIGSTVQDLLRKQFCSASDSISCLVPRSEVDWPANTCSNSHCYSGNMHIGVLALQASRILLYGEWLVQITGYIEIRSRLETSLCSQAWLSDDFRPGFDLGDPISCRSEIP